MCGIFGILTSNQNDNIFQTILNGLSQLQNRGYDSCGIGVLNNGEFDIYKFASTKEYNAIDKLRSLELNTNISDSIHIGIGHNRWATHGAKTDNNSHPHISNDTEFAIVHNGIIENYAILKEFLIENGYIFYSQTDTEIIVNLIAYYFILYNGDIIKSIEKTISSLVGTYGIIIVHRNHPNNVYCVRNGSPLLIGITDQCAIITSEQSGFCNMVNTYITLKNDDICNLSLVNGRIELITANEYSHKKIVYCSRELTLGAFPHWTIKEIYEQPQCILNSINLGGRIMNSTDIKLGGLEHCIDILKEIDNIILLGCGSSFNAALYGLYYFKYLCNFNIVQAFDGAEFTHLDIPRIGKTCFVLISQSGETKDLHRCLQIAKDNNINTIGVINVVDSLIAREVDCGIYCNSGIEVGVASTKSFTSQVVCISLMALWFAKIHNINELKRTFVIKDLQNLSNDFKNTLNSVQDIVKHIANEFIKYNNLFILGKGTDECIAYEGSLKIKELSYIHSEGYSASSLKHGPFALLDENFPVILLNCSKLHTAKVLNCFEEIHSRNSPIFFITDQYFDMNNRCHSIRVSKNDSYSSLLGLIPLQLLSYYIAINKQINPDIPKNLAKVVSVE